MLRQLVAFLSATVLAGAAWAGDYTITGIGMEYSASSAAAINNSGQVVGHVRVGNNYHAVVSNAGVVTDLGTFGTTDSQARDINDSGNILVAAGTSYCYQGFVSFNNPTDYYLLGNSTQSRISQGYATVVSRLSNNGTAMGNYEYVEPDGVYYPETKYGVAIGGGTTTPLPNWQTWNSGTAYLGGPNPDYPVETYSEARDISDSGLIVGGCYGFETSGACMWRNGQITYLSGQHLIEAKAVNASGKIAGVMYVNSQVRMFVWDNGTVADLGMPGGNRQFDYYDTWAMNDSGVIVGSGFDTTSRTYTPFIVLDGTIRDLNTLLPANSGWQLTSVNDINEQGQIVGNGIAPDGTTRGFLLQPVPEPASMLLLLAGGGVLLRRRTTSGN